jgi:hypothetical protein
MTEISVFHNPLTVADTVYVANLRGIIRRRHRWENARSRHVGRMLRRLPKTVRKRARRAAAWSVKPDALYIRWGERIYLKTDA